MLVTRFATFVDNSFTDCISEPYFDNKDSTTVFVSVSVCGTLCVSFHFATICLIQLRTAHNNMKHLLHLHIHHLITYTTHLIFLHTRNSDTSHTAALCFLIYSLGHYEDICYQEDSEIHP